jgi:non-ribosomal peptide synthase protein (TIGR01720 family)
MFTYVGQSGQASDHSIFRLTDHPLGPRRSPRRNRRHLLNVVARVSQDKLQVVWQSSRNVHRISTINRVANDFLASLRTIINGCHLREEGVAAGSGSPMPTAGPNLPWKEYVR